MNKWPKAEVARVLCDYGKERRWKQLARKIVEKRVAGGIHSTSELVELIRGSSFGKKLSLFSIEEKKNHLSSQMIFIRQSRWFSILF